MSSTYNAISMPMEDDVRPRRVPWRSLLCLLLLLAAGAYGVVTYPSIIATHRDELRQHDLPLAGLVAESTECLLADDAVGSPASLAGPIAPLFRTDTDLAFVRVWNRSGRLVYELTNADPATPRTGDAGTLPALGAVEAIHRAQAWVKTEKCLEGIAQLQQLQLDEQDLSDAMQRAIEAGKGAGTHSGLYVRQDDLLRLTDALTEQYPLLSAAREEMTATLDALTHNDAESLSTALHGTENALTAISQTLAELRVSPHTDIVALPAPLLAVAPAPSAWWHPLLPIRAGRRLVTPLYVPSQDNTDALITPAGSAEVVFYDRPSQLAELAIPRLYPSGGLLLAALLVLLLRRRTRRVNSLSASAE